MLKYAGYVVQFSMSLFRVTQPFYFYCWLARTLALQHLLSVCSNSECVMVLRLTA